MRLPQLLRLSRCLLAVTVVLLSALTGGCFSPQLHTVTEHQSLTLRAGELEAHGLAFITPSTVTGQEEDKQALAFTFAEVLSKTRSSVRCVRLPETLGAVNRAGLTEDYKRMYRDYRDTGIFQRELLRRVGEATGARYLAQLKMSGFSQGSQGRWSFLGIRMVDTKIATLRLFFQIWDSREGTIAWEGVQELTHAVDSYEVINITFRAASEQAAHNLIARLP
jgi:hypothetical protein